MTRDEMMRDALNAMQQQNKRIAPAVGRANQLISDFPDEIIDPWTDKELKVGKRILQANITEADEIVINIRMIDGTVGQLTIKATTLAQIIIDRNAHALPPTQEEDQTTTCIDVGDGGIGGDEQTHKKVVRLVNADELLAASRKRASP